MSLLTHSRKNGHADIFSRGLPAQYGPLIAVHQYRLAVVDWRQTDAVPVCTHRFHGRLLERVFSEVAVEEVTETRFAVDTVESTTDCLNDPLFMHRPILNL